MKHLKKFEMLKDPEREDWKKLAIKKPDFEKGDKVFYIGIENKTLKNNKIYTIKKVYYDNVECFYYVNLEEVVTDLFASKFRKCTEEEEKIIKYNV